MESLYKRNSFGENVKRIQAYLNKYFEEHTENGEWDIDVDGIFGPVTEQCVKQYQSEQNLVPDGIVGPLTLRAMNLFQAPPQTNPPVHDDTKNPFVRGSVAWYEWWYKQLKFDQGEEGKILNNTKLLLAEKARYYGIEQKTRVPWSTIGALNLMEGGGRMDRYLGNGQSIFQRTTIVPVGRGPFASWEEGALDALRLQGLTQVLNWSIGLELKYAEQFNGLGYLMYHQGEMSPYVWACSNINDGNGKYVRDGVYDDNAPTNTQVGVATMFKQLELMGEKTIVYS